MSKRNLTRLLTLLITAILAFSVFATGCKKKEKPSDSSSNIEDTTPAETFDNEKDPLVFSTLELDKVFNPFFSTSATDGSVVGMTQIGMIGNSKEGKPTWGDDEPVITQDLQIETTGTPEKNQKTTYSFVLKNDIKFSDGKPLTMKDVFFNLYVYLDPVYTGSSTIYSTDIVGLKEYRTQVSDENEEEQDSADIRFQLEASTRIDTLATVAQEILDKDSTLTLDAFKEALEAKKNTSDSYAHIIEDFNKTLELFRKELENDYSNSLNSYESLGFTNDKGEFKKGQFTTDVEVFLYNEGVIKWNKKANGGNGGFEDDIGAARLNELKGMDKEQAKKEAIDYVYEFNLPKNTVQIIRYWATADELHTFLANKAKEDFFKGSELAFPEIRGIQFANRKAPVTVNGKTYNIPTYNADGSVKSGNEVLTITIKDVDPKAIWNFSFGVAPMHYYSDEKHNSEFSFDNHKFGLEYASQSFMNDVIKVPHIGVPMGAGMYAPSKASGGLENIKPGDFYDKGIVYFERNPYYFKNSKSKELHPATVKKVRYKVVSSTQMLNSLYNKAIDFAEPNAKVETINELKGKAGEGIRYANIQTAGYGYIGVNAGKVPSVKVRRAIMHAMDTQKCVNYYQTTAKDLHRPMSRSSWAYPQDSTAYYPYIGGTIPNDLTVVGEDYSAYLDSIGKTSGQTLSEGEQIAFIKQLVESDGYVLNSDGIYQKGNNTLKLTFTIAGEEQDHPAFDCMFAASKLLNKAGFDVNVQPDANALKKLSSGSLAVWAAAWGSTIDPDMYQVYHKDSKATSTLNWGYKQILNDASGMKYGYEQGLINDLSDLIDQGRKTIDREERSLIYSDALDIVMELAVELPTYQRDDLFAYNGFRIDENSLTPENERSPYNGLTSKLWKVSLVTKAQ